MLLKQNIILFMTTRTSIELESQIIKMYVNDKIFISKISLLVGVSKATVYRCLKRNSIKILPQIILIFSKEEDNIVELYRSKHSLINISKIYNCSQEKIKNVLKTYGILIKSKKILTQEETMESIKLYTSGVSLPEISKVFSVSISQVRNKLIKNNIKLRTRGEGQRKYSLNQHFFDEINNEETAYFFGLLYSDGCNCDNNSIVIRLIEEDKYLLEKLTTLIQPTKPIGHGKSSNYTKNWNDVYSMCICSEHMSKILESYGMVQRKSLIKKFPEVIKNSSEEIQRHFIRGYFDGNGSIMSNKNNIKYSKIEIASTYEMLIGINDIIFNNLKFNGNLNTKRYESTNKNTCFLGIYKREYLFKLYDWFYKDSVIFMKRKFIKYSNFINSF
jgi:intein-encoded DNA endonuclease-like protein